jgi:hypothetical protein
MCLLLADCGICHQLSIITSFLDWSTGFNPVQEGDDRRTNGAGLLISGRRTRDTPTGCQDMLLNAPDCISVS